MKIPFLTQVNKHTVPPWLPAYSIVLAILVLFASLCGLFDPAVYAKQTTNWTLQGQGQDVGNLIAVAVLLFSMYYTGKGSQLARHSWVGTLFYLLYAYIIYSFALHFNYLFLVYVAILGLSVYGLVAAFTHRSFLTPLPDSDSVGRRAAGYVLLVTGGLFALLWLAEVVPATITGKPPESLAETGLWVNPVQVIDLSVVLPGMILTGYSVLRNNKLGHRLAAPWLAFSALMGASIVIAMLLMGAAGFPNVIVPMVMVALIVVASLGALFAYVQHMKKKDIPV